jgi:hypothetical protein
VFLGFTAPTDLSISKQVERALGGSYFSLPERVNMRAISSAEVFRSVAKQCAIGTGIVSIIVPLFFFFFRIYFYEFFV